MMMEEPTQFFTDDSNDEFYKFARNPWKHSAQLPADEIRAFERRVDDQLLKRTKMVTLQGNLDPQQQEVGEKSQRKQNVEGLIGGDFLYPICKLSGGNKYFVGRVAKDRKSMKFYLFSGVSGDNFETIQSKIFSEANYQKFELNYDQLVVFTNKAQRYVDFMYLVEKQKKLKESNMPFMKEAELMKERPSSLLLDGEAKMFRKTGQLMVSFFFQYEKLTSFATFHFWAKDEVDSKGHKKRNPLHLVQTLNFDQILQLINSAIPLTELIFEGLGEMLTKVYVEATKESASFIKFFEDNIEVV